MYFLTLELPSCLNGARPVLHAFLALRQKICTIFVVSLQEGKKHFFILRREGIPGSKKQVWLISKSNLSWCYYFLRKWKIFVYDENKTRQSLRVLLSPIQNIGGKMNKNDNFRSIFSTVLVSQCPNLPKSQILSNSTCFSKFHCVEMFKF